MHIKSKYFWGFLTNDECYVPVKMNSGDVWPRGKTPRCLGSITENDPERTGEKLK